MIYVIQLNYVMYLSSWDVTYKDFLMYKISLTHPLIDHRDQAIPIDHMDQAIVSNGVKSGKLRPHLIKLKK